MPAAASADLHPHGVDALTYKSREFYESTRMKMLMSLIYGSFGMMCLGLCSNVGGRASALNIASAAYDGDDAIFVVQVSIYNIVYICVYVFVSLYLCLVLTPSALCPLPTSPQHCN